MQPNGGFLMNKPTSSYINAIGTAVPAFATPQMQIADFMAEAMQLDSYDRRRLTALYRQTRITQRHSVLPDYGQQTGDFTFYPNTPGLEPFPTVGQRMELYRREALPLALKAVQACFADRNAGPTKDFNSGQITHLITVSCTGLYAPGPDIELVEALGLPTTTQRLAINFMGCYGAFNALKTADAIVRADPDSVVLVVCIELCTIHFQKKTQTDHLLSNALFADGSAAVLIEAKPRADRSMRLRTFFSDLLPDGRNEMAWHVADFGFEMTLTAEVPSVIQHGLGRLLSRLLEKSGLTIGDINQYAMHPGGRRILEVIEDQLGLEPAQNQAAYDVLRENGNMSSATVLFVLNELWQKQNPTEDLPGGVSNVLSCAFGPGLTLESMLLEARSAQIWEPALPLTNSNALIPND
jgi:alpha-pyrone synthase